MAESVCLGEDALIINQSYTNLSIATGNYSWIMGNGDTIKNENGSFYYLYSDTGTYNITLELITYNKCSATVIHPIQIFPAPNIPVEGNVSQCIEDTLPISFDNDFSTVYTWTPSYNITTVLDDSFLIAIDSQVNYQLLAENQFGCSKNAQFWWISF